MAGKITSVESKFKKCYQVVCPDFESERDGSTSQPHSKSTSSAPKNFSKRKLAKKPREVHEEHFNSKNTIRYCYKCKIDFDSSKSRLKHMKTSHFSSKGEYECTDCDITFKSSNDFNNHHRFIKKCTRNRSQRKILIANPKTKSGPLVNAFRCPKCKLEFRTITILRRHFVQHLKTNPFTCSVKGCSSAFGDYYFLKRHVFKLHCKSGKPLQCEMKTHPTCDLKFSTVYYYRSHLIRHHPGVAVPEVLKRVEKNTEKIPDATSKLPSECKLILQFNEALKHDPFVLKLLKKDPKCAEIINRLTLPTSNVLNKRLFQCKICPYSSKMSMYYEKHMKSFHGTDEAFANEDASDCSDSDEVRSSTSLKSSESPSSAPSVKHFYCLYDRCWQRFTSVSQRKRHEKNVHGRFNCSKCDFISPSRLSLKVHYRSTHESDKEVFKCSYCSKIFLRAISMENHTLKHFGENPQKSFCRICGQVYADRHMARRHIEYAHGNDSSLSSPPLSTEVISKVTNDS